MWTMPNVLCNKYNELNYEWNHRKIKKKHMGNMAKTLCCVVFMGGFLYKGRFLLLQMFQTEETTKEDSEDFF